MMGGMVISVYQNSWGIPFPDQAHPHGAVHCNARMSKQPSHTERLDADSLKPLRWVASRKVITVR
jgi:hypothetical protein